MAVDEGARAFSRLPRDPPGAASRGTGGLNDLYVRFFRMAERRIVEKTGQGVVCFISNYSWLDGLSFTGMRERYLDAFDVIRIDNLNGDKYRTGKVAPDGSPDPSIFFHAGGSRRHTGRNGHRHARAPRQPRARRCRRISQPLGTGQARAVAGTRLRRDPTSFTMASSRCCPLACPLRRWRSAKAGSTGPRSPICSRNRFRESRPAADPFLVDVDPGPAQASASPTTSILT